MRLAVLFAGSILMAASVGGAATLQNSAQDTKSPDLQQQAHPQNTPPPSANAPNATSTATTQTSTGRKHHRARQAHGTPAPQSTQTSSTH